jgi:hypothetical protein
MMDLDQIDIVVNNTVFVEMQQLIEKPLPGN